MLCSTTNRFALPGWPSTCALDTSITPTPSFILLTFLAFYFPTRHFLARRRRRISFSSSSLSTSRTYEHSYDPYAYSAPSESLSRGFASSAGPVLPKWTHWTYIALVLCLFGLRVLEVVRLILAHMGIGLLPVGIIANALNVGILTYGGCEMGKSRSLVISGSLTVYWALSTVVETVKVTRLSSYNALHPAKGTDYPSSDWLLDNGCMLGLFVVFLFVEGTYLVLRWRSSFIPVPSSVSGSQFGHIKQQSIGKPRMVDGYDPVAYLDERTAGTV